VKPGGSRKRAGKNGGAQARVSAKADLEGCSNLAYRVASSLLGAPGTVTNPDAVRASRYTIDGVFVPRFTRRLSLSGLKIQAGFRQGPTYSFHRPKTLSKPAGPQPSAIQRASCQLANCLRIRTRGEGPLSASRGIRTAMYHIIAILSIMQFRRISKLGIIWTSAPKGQAKPRRRYSRTQQPFSSYCP
jgi:hypothetical protein